GLKVLATLRPDITYPGDPGATVHKRQRPPSPVRPGALDVDWLPVVAQQGWLILTRDAHIQRHRAAINAVIEHQAKMVALASENADNTWSQLEVVMTQWREIEKLHALPGPLVFAAYRTKLSRVI